MTLSIQMKSNQSELNKEPIRAVAHLLAELLGTCAHCRSGLQGHEYALLATSVVVKGKDDALVSFFQAVKEHLWPKLREFQNWLGRADNVEAYIVRCSGQNLTVAIIKTHFELLHSPRLLHIEALTKEEGNRLLDAFAGLKWLPF